MRKLLLLVFLVCLTGLGYAQVVTQAVDLTSSPNSQVTIKGLDRAGIACKETDLNQQCVVFNIKINPHADILNFEVANPAPSGAAANYRLNCEDSLRRLGPPICVLGQTSLTISFCKKGNDNAHYIFTTSQLVKASDDLTLRVGCSGTMSVTGLTAASTKWTSIFPGTRGTYDSYLSPATGSLTTTVTPGSGAPINGYIDYEVSGNVAATSCSNYPRTDTVRVYVVPTFEVTTTPGSPTLCSNSTTGIVLAALPSGGKQPYTYKWSNGQTTSSITVSSPGDYTVTVYDKTPDCLPITKTMTVTSVAAPSAPAFSGQTICYNQTASISPPSVAGTYTYYDVASGGTALFSGNETQPFITPALTADKTYYVEYTSSCTSPRTSVPITVEPKVDPAFVYPNGGTYCNAATDPTPTMMGGVTGTFTANPNTLSINSSTGKIDLSNSPEGTYTVTFVTSGTCAYTSSATITITNSPNANFTYPNSPYCQTDANPTPSFTNGGSSGTFTVTPAGLIFVNSSTGEIDLKNSIPNTYTVTNTISTGSCGSATANAVIIINAAPTVTAGLDQIVCSGQVVQLNGSFTGASTATWSAPSGSGSFANANDPNTTFTPAANVSSVTLTLTTDDPSGPCTAQSDQVTITINPTPKVTSAEKDTICNNETLPYSITSDIVGTTFIWSRALVSGISNAAVANQTTSLISESLNNYSNLPVEVVYQIIPKTATCTGPPFYYKVLVNPTPQITSSAKDFICSDTPVGYHIQSNVTSGVTYKWIRVDVPNITPSSNGEQQGDLINETLRNSSNSPVDVSYLITPYYGTCPGTPFSYTAVIKPTPHVTSASSSEICNRDSVSYKITGSVNGTTFTWKREAIAGINNGDAVAVHSSNEIKEILENTTTTSVDVVYEITPFYNGCTGDMFTYEVTVNPKTAITNTVLSQIICSEGTSVTVPLTASVTGTTYRWDATAPAALTGYTTSGSGDLPAQTIANSGTVAANVTYTITPSFNGCDGDPVTYTITVNPKTALTNTSLSQTICSQGTSVAVPLTASVTGTTFRWNATAPAALTGYTASGTGDLPAQTIANSGSVAANVTYTITPSYNGCDGTPATYTITVNPKTAITNTVLSQTICSQGTSVVVQLTASLTGTTFRWNATAPAALTGYTASGTGDLPAQTIANSGTTAADVVYTITPSFNGCDGTPVTYTITVNPKTSITNTVLSQTICSQETSTAVPLTASVTGTTYRWNATAPAALTGYTASGTGDIPAQTIANSGSVAANVTYTITPSYNGCDGTPATYTITVNPKTAITNTVLSQIICSEGTSVTVPLTAYVTGTTFRWNATAPAALTGYTTSGSGDLPAQTIANSGTTAADVVYTITPSFNGCDGTPVTYTITVNPKTAITNTVLSQIICSERTSVTVPLTASVTGTTYRWNATAPAALTGYTASGTGDLPAQTIANSGSVAANVTYTITPSYNGCDGTPATYTITVNPKTAITNTVFSQTICSEGISVAVPLTASVTGTTYRWNATAPAALTGYTTSGSGDLPAQTIANSGTVAANVTYTITPSFNGCDGDPVTYTITVNPKTAITNTVLSQIICSEGTSVTVPLTASVTGTTYRWNATAPDALTGYSASGTGNLPAQTITNSGTTTADVVYTITPSFNGCDGTPVTYTITVNPKTSITNTVLSQTICSGTTSTAVPLTASVNGTSYRWNATAPAALTGYTASGTGDLPAQTIANSGTVAANVTYTITPSFNSCDGAPVTYTITVNPKTTIANTSLSQTICSGATSTAVPLTASVTGTTYRWSATAPAALTGYTASGTGDLPAQTITNSGTVAANVTYTITPSYNGCDGTPVTYYIIVNPAPSTPSIVGSTTICSGGSTILTATGSSGTYQWYDVNGTKVGDQASFQTPALNQNSTYYVETTVNGCTSPRRSVTIIIAPIPQKPEIKTNSPICAGSDLQLRTSALYANAEYIWTGPNNFSSSQQNPVITNATTAASGVYSLYVKVNGCISEAETVNVTVGAIPTVTKVTADTICIQSSGRLEAFGTAGTYNWYRTATGGLPVSTGNVFNTPLLDSTTTYYVDITSAIGCISPRVPVTALVLYPENPAFKYPTGTYCITSPANPKPDIYAKGGGTFSVNNPALKFVSTTTGEINLASTVPGKYLITFTANNSCAYISTAEMTITDKPSAKFVYLNAGQFCQSDPNPTPSFPDGGSAGVFTTDNSGLVFINNTTGEINLKASKPGTYLLKNTISGGGCLPDSAFYPVRIYEAPVVEAGADQTICSTEKATLNGSFSGSATGVIWSAPSGTFSNVNDPHAVYTPAPGTSSVTLRLTTFDPSGPCTAVSDTLTVTIKQTPAITSAASDSVCNNQTLNYRITTTVPSALITWSREPVAGVFSDAVTDRIGDVINETLVNTTNTVQKVVYKIKASNLSCESGTFTYTVFVKPSAVISNTILSQALCSGSKTQSVTWLGFATGTTFVWSATASPTITGYLKNGTGNLPEQTLVNAGTEPASLIYTVTPYFNGCAGTPVNYAITVNPIPSAPAISSNSPVCIGNILQLQTQTSYPEAEYFWTGPNNFSSNLQNPAITNISASAAGDYHLTIRVNGCSSSVSTLTVQVESSPAAPTVTPVSICINTSAKLEASGPTGTYNWYTSASGGSSIATGKIYNTPLLDSTRTYYVDVTSAAGCTGPRQAVTATVLYPENPAFKYSSGTYCRSAGFHPIPVLTGNSGGTFSSAPGLVIVNAATGEIDPAASSPGIYTVKFVANVSCQYESFADITITDDPKPGFSYPSGNYCQKDINPLPVFPAGNSGGVFSVDKPGLIFVNSSTGEINLSKSTPGTYTITNTISGGGCQTVSATFDVSIFEAPIVDAGTVAALCPNEKATLHGRISGGASQGFWSAPSGTFSDVNDLNAVYTPAPGVSSVLLTLTSTDPAGPCSAITDTVRVRINPVLVITSSSSDSVCNNQNLNYRITNTAPDAIIKWSRSKVTGITNEAVTDRLENFIDEVLINTTNSVQRVIYNITASNNCEARTHTYIVYVKPTTKITTTNLSQEVCSGSQTQRVTFSPSITGTTYSWTATAPDFVTGYTSNGQGPITEQTITNNGTAPASVIYTVTPFYKGCPGTPVLYTIIVKPKPLVSGVNSSVVCSNEAQAYTIESPVAGTSFTWRRPFVNGISNSAGSGTGSKITEALINTTSSPVLVKYFITPYYQGCTGQEFEYAVTVKATPIIKVSSLTKEICSGETLEEIPLEASIPGTTFTWTATTSGSLNSIQAFGSGNIPSQTLSTTGSTTATITYKINYSFQGCPGTEATYVVKVKAPIQTPAIASNSPICKDVTLQLSAANLTNASYYWSGPDNFQSNLQNTVIPAAQVKNAGKYSLFVVVNGCASPVKEINVAVNEDPISVAANSNSPTCANSTIVLSATHYEGAVYSWTGPNNFTSNLEQPQIPNATPAMAGRYHVTVTAPGCSSTGSGFVDVSIKPTPAPPVVSNEIQICSGETLVLSANGNANGTYLWTGPNNFSSTEQYPRIENVDIQHAGEYKVTITVDGCTSTAASTIVTVNQTAIAFAGGNRTVCASDSIVTLSGSLSGPALAGVWKTTGTGKFDPDATNLITNYKLSKDDIRAGQVDIYLDPVVSSASTCPPKPAYITLNIAPTPTVSAGEDQEVCSNIAEVSLSGAVTIASSATWSSSGTGTFLPSASDLNAIYKLSERDIATGNVTLTLTSENTVSCTSARDQMNIKVIQAPKVDAGRIVYVFKDEFVTLKPVVSGEDLKYKWFPGDFMDDSTSRNPKIKGVADRVYHLSVTGKGGCAETDEVQIIVLEPVNPPNTFTPNGDNKNDYWNIPQLAKYPGVKVSIFNRYGTKIHTSTGYDTPWDGNYEGKPVPVGVYYYVIDISMFGKKLSGYITVLH